MCLLRGKLEEFCHRFSKASFVGIKDKAQKLEYYARIRDDKPTETRFAEIKLRAIIKIGELSRELERHSGGKVKLDTDDQFKSEALKQA